ncbi:MAG: hypothetical protein ACXW1W_11380 [Methylococcaceae bacterium]
MKKRNYLLLSAALLSIGLMFATNGVARGPAAGVELFSPANNDTPPRTCELDTKVTIVAGLNGDPTAPFPRVVTCPGADCPTEFTGITAQYLRWDYSFTYHGVTPSHAFLSVSGDTQLFFTSPSSIVSSDCAGDSYSKAGKYACELHFMRYNVSSSTFTAYYLTSLNWSPRIATAGAQAGSFQDFCLLAGAGKPPSDQNQIQEVTEIQTVLTPGCRVELTRDSKGRVENAQITEGADNCSIEVSPDPILIDGKRLLSELRDPVTTEGSCNYSYTNSIGGKTTIACSTCCVQSSTNKCVLKSSLSSPTTQCTAGSQ